MGTRASFWIGDPRDYDNRRWLGCIAYDGYPMGVINDSENFAISSSKEEFVNSINDLALKRNDFANVYGGWPFPWADDIFLTDYTYAFFDGQVWVANYYSSFILLSKYLECSQNDNFVDFWDNNDPTMHNISAPTTYDCTQPDSILIITN